MLLSPFSAFYGRFELTWAQTARCIAEWLRTTGIITSALLRLLMFVRRASPSLLPSWRGLLQRTVALVPSPLGAGRGGLGSVGALRFMGSGPWGVMGECQNIDRSALLNAIPRPLIDPMRNPEAYNKHTYMHVMEYITCMNSFWPPPYLYCYKLQCAYVA